MIGFLFSFFFFKQKTAYEMRISDWSSDVCSSDLAARQAEAIFGERDLAAMVALRHRADLRDRLVTLVDEEQGIVGQIFEQGRRRLARKAAGEEAAVILDPRAAAGRGDHLEVEIGALRSEEHTSELQSLMRISYA